MSLTHIKSCLRDCCDNLIQLIAIHEVTAGTLCAADVYHSMNLQTIKASCSNCNLRELCMPMGLDAEQMQRIDDIVATRRKVKRGGLLFRNGETFTSLYAIRTGFFKTCVATEDGRDQVTGFQMAGEIIGLDGIVNDHHTCDAVSYTHLTLPTICSV